MNNSIMSQYNIVHDLIRTTMQRLSVKTKITYISKKKIMKILYLAKNKMHDDNSIKKELAYYWYLEGPFSEVVQDSMNHLISTNMITCSKTQTSETYQFDSNRIHIPLKMSSDKHNSDDIQKARKYISDIVDDFQHIESMVNIIYEDAPYTWYKTYKQNFKVKFDNFCAKVLNDDYNSSMYTYKDITHVLEDAALDFPQFPDFPELYRTFMKFTRLLNSFLHTKNCTERKDIFLIFQNMSDLIWRVFAYGIRIKHHDEYYTEKINEWTLKYNNEMTKLDAYINQHQSQIEQISTHQVKISSHIIDIKQHPEKYEFTKLELDNIKN